MSVMAKNKPKPSTGADDSEAEWVTRSIRFPPGLYERIEGDAKAARRSTQLQIIWMLEELYRRQQEEKK
jgi:hypothetical protein